MNIDKVKNNFNSKGFVVIKNLFNELTIKNLLKDKKRIVEKIILKGKVKKKTAFHKTKDGKVNTIHNIQNFNKKSFAVKLSKSKKILALTNKILNGETKMRNVEYFLKPKKTGMPAPFHQDNFYWNIEKAKAVNVWIACSKSSKKNGGLIYLEKSHRHGILNHKISYAPGSSQKIDDKKLKKLKYRKVCPTVNPGDVIIHHANIIHGSLANTSPYDRVGCVMSFKVKNAKVIQKKFNKYKESAKKNINKIYNLNNNE